MTPTATTALRFAQQVIDAIAASDIDGQGIEIDGQIHNADEIRFILRRGLESLRQGPAMLDAIGLDTRLRQASRKAGSDAALARQIGITRQCLADVMSGGGAKREAAVGLGWAVPSVAVTDSVAMR